MPAHSPCGTKTTWTNRLGSLQVVTKEPGAATSHESLEEDAAKEELSVVHHSRSDSASNTFGFQIVFLDSEYCRQQSLQLLAGEDKKCVEKAEWPHSCATTSARRPACQSYNRSASQTPTSTTCLGGRSLHLTELDGRPPYTLEFVSDSESGEWHTADHAQEEELSRELTVAHTTKAIQCQTETPQRAELTQQSASRSSLIRREPEKEETGILCHIPCYHRSNLDGTQEPIDSKTRDTQEEAQRREEIGENVTSEREESGLVPESSSASGSRRSLKVAERIQAFELKKSILPTHGFTRKHHGKHNASASNTQQQDPGVVESSVNSQVPLVFPLHVKKYHRRTNNGRPVMGIESPLYRSASPAGESVIYSPQPQRSIPIVQTPPGTPVPLEIELEDTRIALQKANTPFVPTSDAMREGLAPGIRADATYPSQASAESATDNALSSSDGKQSSAEPSKYIAWQPKLRVSQFAHFHGTRESCVRHGRKSEKGQRLQGFQATQAMIGWSGSAGSKSGSDACPDCVAELGIQRREIGGMRDTSSSHFVEQASLEDVQTPVIESIDDLQDSQADATDRNAASMTLRLSLDPPVLETPVTDDGEPPLQLRRTDTLTVENLLFLDDVRPSGRVQSRVQSWGSTRVQAPSSEFRTPGSDDDTSKSTPADAPENTVQRVDSDELPRDHSKSVRFREPSDAEDADLLVISRDLGEGLDAMILERGGRLECVVTNVRHGAPTMDMMAKLSRELMSVSAAFADAPIPEQRGPKEPRYGQQTSDRTVVVDGNARRCSVPELLNLFDEATGDLEPGLIRKESITSTYAQSQLDLTARHHDEESRSDQSFASLDDEDDMRGRATVQNPVRRSNTNSLTVPPRIDEQLLGVLGPARPGSPCAPSFERRESDLFVHDQYEQSFADRTSEFPGIPPGTREPAEGDMSPLEGDPQPQRLPAQTRGSTRPPARRIDSNLGSTTLPVRVTRSSIAYPDPTGPILPSHVLKTTDFPSTPPVLSPSSPLFRSLSPLLSPESTVPSTTSSAASSAQASPQIFTASTAPSLTGTPPPFDDATKVWSTSDISAATVSPSQRRADSQIIRHVMRMEKNRAVQEAAEAERRARRRRRSMPMVGGGRRRAGSSS